MNVRYIGTTSTNTREIWPCLAQTLIKSYFFTGPHKGGRHLGKPIQIGNSPNREGRGGLGDHPIQTLTM